MSLPPPESAAAGNDQVDMVTNWPVILATSAAMTFFMILLVLAAFLVPHANRRMPQEGFGQQARAIPVVTAARLRPKVVAAGRTSAASSSAKPTREQTAKSEAPVTQPPAPSSPTAGLPRIRTSKPAVVRAGSPAKPVPASVPPQHRSVQSRSKDPEPPAPTPLPAFAWWDGRTEEMLARELRIQAPEVKLDATKDTSAKILTRSSGKAADGLTVLDLLADRADLRGLPFQKGASCRRESRSARALQASSSWLRREMDLSDRNSLSSGSPAMSGIYAANAARQAARQFEMAKSLQDSVPVLAQVLQDREEQTRSVLVEIYSHLKQDSKARTALARLAIFDLSDPVRHGAVQELQYQPHEECRAVFLAGLRYPWAPVADHAAEALVALGDKAAVPDLIRLLDEPDPAAPYLEHGKWQVRELVAINHLRNCLLCHAPSFDRADLVRAPIPEPGKPLPSVYYTDFRGPVITAAITYLRQDFSVRQPVADHGRWPQFQRYDYLVRVRELSEQEQKRLDREKQTRPVSGPPRSYPQREAVLFALSHLAGKKPGPASTD